MNFEKQQHTKKGLEKLIKLSESEIKEWQAFRIQCKKLLKIK